MIEDFDKAINELRQELTVRDFMPSEDIEAYCAKLTEAHYAALNIYLDKQLKTLREENARLNATHNKDMQTLRDKMNVKQLERLLKWYDEREIWRKRIAELEAQLPKVVVPHKKFDPFPAKWVGHFCSCGDSVRQGTKACSACGSLLDWTEVEK